MTGHVPFVNTKDDCQFLKKYYSDSTIVRVSLEKLESIVESLPRNLPLWIDAGVDGYEHCLRKEQEPVPAYLRAFTEHEVLSSKDSIEKRDMERVRRFVNSVLNRCWQYRPSWITVPQLPIVDDNSRNRINSALASSTYEWKLENQFRGKFILPLIFTNQKQLQGKTKWRPKLDSALKWYIKAGADGVWVVDSSLSDQMGTETFRKRFPALIELHKYMRDKFKEGTVVLAGPYWGMNIILWVRGLCDYPAICLGTAYQYHISGGFKRRGRVKLAIPPLRRLAVASPELRRWLDKAIKSLNPKDEAYKELFHLRNNYNSLSTPFASKGQITKFYKAWFDKIEQTPSLGRSLALYQDLSSAYVLGKQLPTLPPSGGFARKPEKVAESYMFNCL